MLSDSSPESVAGSSPRQGPRAARVKACTSAAQGKQLVVCQVEAAGLGSSSEGCSEGWRSRHGGSSEDEACLAGRAGVVPGQAASGSPAVDLTAGSPETDCSSVPTPTLPVEVPEPEAGLSGDTLPQPPSGPGSQQLAANSFRAGQAEQGPSAWSPEAADAAGRGSLSRTATGDASPLSDDAGGRQHAGDQLAASSSAKQLLAQSPLPARHAAAVSCEPGVTPTAHRVVLLSGDEEEASPIIWGTARRLGSHSRSVCATSAGCLPCWYRMASGMPRPGTAPSRISRVL